MAIVSRQVTESRYAGHRAAALRRAEDILRKELAPTLLTLRAITPESLAAFSTQWQDHTQRLYPWPWHDMAGDYRRHEPTRFEAAVWSADTLCGLALGRLRAGYCSLDYLEGSPAPAHPLRGMIIPAVLTALTAYALALDRPEIRLIDPLPALVPLYEGRGFVLATPRREARYWWKAIP
jgi:hypothetical protein